MLQAWETQAGLENDVHDRAGHRRGVARVLRQAAVRREGYGALANGTGTHPAFTIPENIVTAMQKYVADIDALETAEACPAPAFQLQ